LICSGATNKARHQDNNLGRFPKWWINHWGGKNNNYSANQSFAWFYHGLYLWHPYTNLYYIPMISPYWVARNIIPSAQDPRKPQSLHGFGFVVRHHGGHTQQNHLQDRTDDLRIRAERKGIQWNFIGFNLPK